MSGVTSSSDWGVRVRRSMGVPPLVRSVTELVGRKIHLPHQVSQEGPAATNLAAADRGMTDLGRRGCR